MCFFLFLSAGGFYVTRKMELVLRAILCDFWEGGRGGP